MTGTLRLRRTAVALALAASPVAARAASFDPTGYITREGNGFTLDEPALDDGLAHLVAALRPAFGSTGATTGARGFALELGLGWTPIQPGSDTWRRGLGDDAPDALSALHIEARKGLPAGFELTAAVSHEASAGLTHASFGLRWAWLEGSLGLPDLGIRVDGGAIVGDAQMTLATAGLELVAGYPVPVVGLFRMAPYAGFSFRYARSIERRIAVFDGVSADPFVTVLPSQDLFLSHAIIGLRVQSSALDVGLEATLGTTVGLLLQVGARL